MVEEENIRFDKLISDGNTFDFPVCNKCKWNRGDGTCRAFPEGIPDEILNGENDHNEPLPDQRNNITFESIEEEEE